MLPLFIKRWKTKPGCSPFLEETGTRDFHAAETHFLPIGDGQGSRVMEEMAPVAIIGLTQAGGKILRSKGRLFYSQKKGNDF